MLDDLVRALSRAGVLLLIASPVAAQAVTTSKHEPFAACTRITSASDTLGGQVGLLVPGPKGAVAWTDHFRAAWVVVEQPGRPPARVGRAGRGPGEFSSVGAAGWRDDSLWAADREMARVHLFTPAGRVARTINAPGRADWSLVRGDTLIGFAGHSLGDPVVALVRSAPGARRTLDTVAIFRGPPVGEMHIPVGPERSIVGGQPFAERVVPGYSPDGRRWCVAAPLLDRAAVRVTCVAPSGKRLLEAEVSTPLRRLTDTLYDAAVDRVGANMPQVPRSRIAAAIRRPPTIPRATALLIGNDGQLWLGRSVAHEPSTTWIRLDRQGRLMGALELSSSIRPRLIAAETVYVVVSDTDDLQRAERCRLWP